MHEYIFEWDRNDYYPNVTSSLIQIVVFHESAMKGFNGAVSGGTKELALELGYSPEEGRKFMHEYIFEWEIKDQYVELPQLGPK
jgi:hypothetical protein